MKKQLAFLILFVAPFVRGSYNPGYPTYSGNPVYYANQSFAPNPAPYSPQQLMLSYQQLQLGYQQLQLRYQQLENQNEQLKAEVQQSRIEIQRLMNQNQKFQNKEREALIDDKKSKHFLSSPEHRELNISLWKHYNNKLSEQNRPNISFEEYLILPWDALIANRDNYNLANMQH